MMRLAVLALALLAAPSALAIPVKNFTGYIVTGQWDGRTVPDVQWALDVTRQDTAFRAQQELKLQNLIPTTPGDALSPLYTAYDQSTRAYFLSVQRNNSAASLWGFTLSGDVSQATPLNTEVRFAYPEIDAAFVSLQVLNNGGVLQVLAFFADGTVLAVDYKTGLTRTWANLCTPDRVLTTAFEKDPATQNLYMIAQGAEGAPNRSVITLSLINQQRTEVSLAPLADHNPLLEQAFELVWMPTLKHLLVFYSGIFDQLVYLDPTTGKTAFACNSIAQFSGDEGTHFEFTANPFLEDDDLWSDAAIDLKNNIIYFQVSDVDDDGDVTTALASIPVPDKLKELTFINTSIEPMTYGYVGMQYVQTA